MRALDREVERRLRKALTRRQLEVWELNVADWKDKAIAAHLGISEGAVSATIARCRQKLREAFSGFGST